MSWSEDFRRETAPVITDAWLACLAEAIATVECAAGKHVLQNDAGLNEIGYKAIPGKPSISAATQEAAPPASASSHNANDNSAAPRRPEQLVATRAAFRLFRDRREQAASLLYLMHGSPYYESARLLFMLVFYAAYAPGRLDGARSLIAVFNRIAATGAYPNVRPLALLTSASFRSTREINHAAARQGVRLFCELTGELQPSGKLP